MAQGCLHLAEIANLQPPKLFHSVHREECTQCFDNQDQPAGIEVCLSCFNGGCLDPQTRHHALTHVQKSGHPFTLNVKRILKGNRNGDDQPPAKITKLAIVEEREEDKYEHLTVVKCWKCEYAGGRELPEALVHPKIKALVDGVMQSMSSARQSEVKAWEQETAACEHTLTLEQFATSVPASGQTHCSKCDLKENLWLCLTCGSIGCGRRQAGGLNGNGHGLQHYEESKHAVSVKLGTITPEGSADLYCYVCDDAVLDLELALHLSTFGINVQTQTKTEKSITELQIEHNLKFDFSLTGEDGKALEPVFGPGLTGLANMGNTCYIASVVQVLFALPAFQQRYQNSREQQEHWIMCQELLPAACLDCQMYKLADGLLSGRYSHPAPTSRIRDPLLHESPTPVFQDGVRPATFRALIGKGHAEFSTMKQQDSEEFLTYLLTSLRRNTKKTTATSPQPTEVFSFGMEQRLQCGECKRVSYRIDPTDVVSFAVPAKEAGKDDEGKVKWEEVKVTDCLDALAAVEALEYRCPACAKNVIATKQSKFSTFPEVLVIHAKKFQLVNWVPSKLDISLILPPQDELVLDKYVGRGRQPGEAELPNDAPVAPELPHFNEAAMAQLQGMGFPLIRCQKALLETGNNDAEAAMEWLFMHMDDSGLVPDIDAPIQTANRNTGPEPSVDQISLLTDMGFTTAQARKALRETNGNTERAVDWLFNHPGDTGESADSASSSVPAPASSAPILGSASLPAKYKLKAFISHKGPSVHSGHYVAHIRVGDDEWVLFNDEKVVKADKESVRELKKQAYLYIFEKV